MNHQPHQLVSSPQKVDKEHNNLRIALVCDWLTTPGGAEKVLLELHHMYPEAPIYTSQYNRKGIDWFDDAEVHTGWLQIFPAKMRKFLGPLRQIYFSHLDLSDYDLVISVTGAEAKSIRTRRRDGMKTMHHLCYCHVPTQYYWQMYDKYIDNPGFGIFNPFVGLCLKLLVKPLRRADYAAAQLPDQFVTISNYANQQIKKYYQREATVIAPPVETEKFAKPSSKQELLHKFSTNNINFSATIPQRNTNISTKKYNLSTNKAEKSTAYPQLIHNEHKDVPDYYIIACRQVTWKRVDLAIRACLQAQLPLLVIGDGPEHVNLVKLAGGSPLIQFLPWTSTEDLAIYLQNAKGYIFPSLEPFGIAAVEALAAGCPVIAYAEGGSRDFIRASENGVLFSKQEVAALVGALQKFEKLSFQRAKVKASAQRFDAAEFRSKIQQAVVAVTGSDNSVSQKPQSTQAIKTVSDSKTSKSSHLKTSQKSTKSSKGAK